VAVRAGNRTEAVRKIRAAGVKPSRASVSAPLNLKDADLAAVTTDEVWIRGLGLAVNGTFINDDQWRPADRFRELYTP
jgi:hypothetical protein